MNFYYYCPAVRKPTGGVKVIYQHVQALNDMGVNAWVVHPKSNFRCTWFENNAPVWNKSSISAKDHLIIPESDTLNLAELLTQHSIQFSIFVQGGHCVPHGRSAQAFNLVKSVYEKSQSILSISQDTSEIIASYFPSVANKIIRVQPAISRELFQVDSWEEKENVITYMPRKNPELVEMVLFGIKDWLPASWRLQPINNVSEQEAARLLRKSKIFLSFASFEGFGLPPLEAALSGNYVIGHHGNGGKEYWSVPVFHEIYPYDVSSFIEAIKSRVASLEEATGHDGWGANPDFPPTLEKLSKTYSTYELHKLLGKFVERAESIAGHSDLLSEKLTVQHSPLVAWFIRKKRKFNRI